MTDQSDQLRQGHICWIVVTDHNGIPKNRPVVIITPTEEIILDSPVVAVAITTTFPAPPPKEFVPLPWLRTGHPATGFRRPSAAKCDWLVALQPSDVSSIEGYLPTKHLLKVVQRVREITDQPDTQ